jgi:hypothetical protein
VFHGLSPVTCLPDGSAEMTSAYPRRETRSRCIAPWIGTFGWDGSDHPKGDPPQLHADSNDGTRGVMDLEATRGSEGSSGKAE